MAYYGFDYNSFLSGLDLNQADMGTKPATAPPINVDSAASTNTALDNINNSMGRYQGIASTINTFNQAQFDQMREMSTPGIGNLMKDTTSAIDKLVGGGLPDSILADIQRTSAEQSVSFGFGGTQLANTAAATQVGLASLKQIDQALAQSSDWLGKVNGGVVQPFDMTKLMISPEQQTQIDYQNQLNKQQQDQYAFNTAAAPTPAAAYKMSLGSTLMGAVVASNMYNNQNNGQQNQMFRYQPTQNMPLNGNAFTTF